MDDIQHLDVMYGSSRVTYAWIICIVKLLLRNIEVLLLIERVSKGQLQLKTSGGRTWTRMFCIRRVKFVSLPSAESAGRHLSDKGKKEKMEDRGTFLQFFKTPMSHTQTSAVLLDLLFFICMKLNMYDSKDKN